VVLRLSPNEPITPVSSHSHFRFRFNSNGNLRDICEHPTAFRDPNGAGPAATRSGQGRLALASLRARGNERNRSRTARCIEPAVYYWHHHNISNGQSIPPYAWEGQKVLPLDTVPRPYLEAAREATAMAKTSAMDSKGVVRAKIMAEATSDDPLRDALDEVRWAAVLVQRGTVILAWQYGACVAQPPRHGYAQLRSPGKRMQTGLS
jgi:hypothetical protein